MALLPLPASAADGIVVPDGVTVTPGGENCKGVVPTPGSENTDKVLDPLAVQDLTPGGQVKYLITFPTDPNNVGTFEIVDCVLLIGPGGAPKDYKEVLTEVSFSKVNNSADFRLEFAYNIPANATNGDQICNVAKTTASPSKSPGSNRKAGPACFVIGGSGRVEKHDSVTGDLLDGATFSIHDCVLGAGADPAIQPIIVSLEDAAGNPITAPMADPISGLVTATVEATVIGFNGPSGSSCQVTETAPPDGYTLPPVGQRTVTVAIGARTQATYVFNDTPIPTNLSLTKTADAATVDAGQDIGFTITISNGAGATTAHDVAIQDSLPTGTGISWSIASGLNGTSCGIVGGLLSCAFGDLAGGLSKSVHVTSPTTVQSCTTYPNVASVTSTNGSAPNASASTTVRCPGLNLKKDADAPIVDAGQPIGFTVTVSNTKDAGTATGVHISDVLPIGPGISWSITSPPTGCSIVNGVLGCDFGDIAGDSSKSVHVVSQTTKASCATYPNTASLTATIGSAPNASEQTVVQCPLVTLEKTADAATVNAGDSVGFVIKVSNAGPATAKAVTVSDTLQSGSGLVWSIASGLNGAACTLVGSALNCPFGDIPAGEFRSVHVTSPTTAATCLAIPNTATATVANGANPASAQATVTVKCPALAMVKTADSPNGVSAGQPIGFLITVTNGADAGTAKAVTVTDELPTAPGVNWSIAADSTDAASCSIVGTTLTCEFGDLVAGANRSVHITSPTTAASCTTYPNIAELAATNGSAPDAAATTTVNCPSVTIDKSPDSPLVEAGSQVGFTLEVSNAGPGVARDVVVTDNLPGGLAWTVDEANLPDGVVCDITDGVLTCLIGDLAVPGVDSTPQVSIHLIAPTAAPTGDSGTGDCSTYPNSASAAPANGADDTSATVTVTVRCPLDIGLTKTGPALAHVGDTLTYNFSVTNRGYVDLVNVDLIDGICDAGSPVLLTKGDGDGVLEIDLNSNQAGLQREVWTYRCTRVVRATDPDPLPNTATVTGTDVDNRTTTDTASWLVDLIHPAITIVKTANPVSVSVSGPVTYTYVVTNTGDVVLHGIVVTDDIIGAIGTVASLAPGESATLTKTVVVDATTPATNIGTATGIDLIGKTVTATDDATITVVLGVVVVEPTVAPAAAAPVALPLTAPPAVAPLVTELPRTGGGPLQAQTWAALAMIQVGLILTLAGRRRWTIRRAG